MKQFFQDVKNSFLLSAAVSIILGIVLIVAEKAMDKLKKMYEEMES